MTLRAAAEQALDTLEHVQAHIGRYDPPVVTTIARAMQPTIDALRAALAAEQPQPEAQPTVGVQACRPEDRAMLATPAGAELLAKVALALTVPRAVATAPERIWLQIGDDRAHMDEPFPGDEVTWCADSVVDAEVEYVRADLAPTLAAEQPQPACPHIRSSGTGEWATHWCALNGPPSAPEPSEAQDAARYRWLRAGREGVEFRDGDGKWRADCPGGDDLDQIIDAALRAAAAARGR